MGRNLPLNRNVQNTIEDFIEWKRQSGESLRPTVPLFCTTRTQKRLVPRDLQRMMQKVSAVLDQKFTLNDLRHTFATELYGETEDLEFVRIALGLSRLKSEQAAMYIRSCESRSDEVSQPLVNTHASAAKLESPSIEGTILMLDSLTPHVSIVVQVVVPNANRGDDCTVVVTALSNREGNYQFCDLPPGAYQVRCYTLNGYVYYQDGESVQVRNGQTAKDIDFRIRPFKTGTWKRYTTRDGLAAAPVSSIAQDSEGVLWFGAASANRGRTGSAVSRFDGKTFTILTKADGLGNDVWTIFCAPDGAMWFGTPDDGVFRYDGREFENFTTEDRLSDNCVYAIDQDADGVMWFGTEGGVSCYNGWRFENFTTEDGLADNCVFAVSVTSDGAVWFGTKGGGVSRYDPLHFPPYEGGK